MANLRIIYDNALDRGQISATSSVGNLVPANIKNDRKSKVWRSSGTTGTLTITWQNSEMVSGVILPICNLTSSSTAIIKIYEEIADSTPIYNSGTINMIRIQALGLWDWGSVPLGVNAYSFGGGAYGVKWLDNVYVGKKITIELSDPGNPSGYLELSKIVVGTHWSPVFNTGFGMTSGPIDTSTRNRSESGDLVIDRNPIYKTMGFDLSWMQASDRQRFNEIIKNNGTSRSMFISLFPDDSDAEKEQTYQIYGKLAQTGSVTHTMHTIYAGRIDIEEI